MKAPKPDTRRKTAIVVAYGLAGWAMCATTMGIGMSITTLHYALIVHAIAAPLIFVAVSAFYFRGRNIWSPLQAAVAFLATVATMDLFVVALMIQRSFVMFTSILGVWLPFLFIFLASWSTGLIICGGGGTRRQT